MADEQDKNNFMGGGMTGAPVPSAPDGKVTSLGYERERRIRDRGVVSTTGTKVTEVRDRREPLDTNSRVLFADCMGRPYELHSQGAEWEATRGITRRFAVGQTVWLIMRVSLRDEYIMLANPPGMVKGLADKLPCYDAGSLGKLPYLESFTYQVKVIEHEPDTTITVGLLPLYVVEVQDGPAKGLRFLAYPSDLMDEHNLDGHGIDRILRRKKDGMGIPAGFSLKSGQPLGAV